MLALLLQLVSSVDFVISFDLIKPKLSAIRFFMHREAYNSFLGKIVYMFNRFVGMFSVKANLFVIFIFFAVVNFAGSCFLKIFALVRWP